MGHALPPVSQTLFLAFAGLSPETTDLLDQVGWFLPFLALVLPISLILFLAISNVTWFLLLGLQGSTLYVGLRFVVWHLRHRGFSSLQAKMMLGPIYLVACFLTNILVLLAYDLLRR